MFGRGNAPPDPQNRVRRANRQQAKNKAALGEKNAEFEGFVPDKVRFDDAEKDPVTTWSDVGRHVFDEKNHPKYRKFAQPSIAEELSATQLELMLPRFKAIMEDELPAEDRVVINQDSRPFVKSLLKTFFLHYRTAEASKVGPKLKDADLREFTQNENKRTKLYQVFRTLVNDPTRLDKLEKVQLKNAEKQPVPMTTFSGVTAAKKFRAPLKRKLYAHPSEIADLLFSFQEHSEQRGKKTSTKVAWIKEHIPDVKKFLASSIFPAKPLTAKDKYDVPLLHKLWKKLRGMVLWYERNPPKPRKKQKGGEVGEEKQTTPPKKRKKSESPPLPVPRPDERYRASAENSVLNPANVRFFMSRNGGPFGHYLMDLLDMGKNSGTYNDGYKYIFTVMNTNSRFVYGRSLKTKESKEVRRAMESMMDQMDADSKAEGMKHRKMTAATFDGGKEFERWMRQEMQDRGIAVQFTEKSAHEELSRLNSFHRRLRELYQQQWLKFKTNPSQYGGPVKWVADRNGGGVGTEVVPASPAARPKPSAAELQQLLDELNELRVEQDMEPLASLPQDDDEEEKGAPSAETRPWRITFWQDWIDILNRRVKKRTFQGAELVQPVGDRHFKKPRSRPLAPIDIRDEHVRRLIAEDEAVSDEVAKRVDQWIKDNNVVWENMLPDDKKSHATRVRYWTNRSFVENKKFLKKSLQPARWSERFYPLVDRVGSNTFSIRHGHGSDVPTIWPMYRLLIVSKPSMIAQPTEPEGKFSDADQWQVVNDIKKLYKEAVLSSEQEKELKKLDEKAAAKGYKAREKRVEPAPVSPLGRRSRGKPNKGRYQEGVNEKKQRDDAKKKQDDALRALMSLAGGGKTSSGRGKVLGLSTLSSMRRDYE